MKPDFGDVAELQRRLAAAADAQAEARAARAGELSRRQREQEQSRRRQDLAAALRDASGLRGTIYDDASLDSLEHPRRRLTPAQFEQYVAARDDVRSLLREPGILVLSSRDPGPGKTYLGAALVNAFCDAGRPARFLDMHQFYIELFSTFGAPGRTREDFYERMYGYDLLVLDEIERRPKTEFRNEEFFHLVNQRQIRRGKSTVLTTNLTLAQLNGADESGPFLPPAVRDRIGHTGGTVIVFDWPTLRGEPRPRVNGNGRAA